jgi:hypothetical protein
VLEGAAAVDLRELGKSLLGIAILIERGACHPKAREQRERIAFQLRILAMESSGIRRTQYVNDYRDRAREALERTIEALATLRRAPAAA